ncbi:MAG: VIT1/CCC1 transporter family protein [Chlamydiota bacterium]
MARSFFSKFFLYNFRKILRGRIRGKAVTSDFYQSEMPDHMASFVEATKDTTLILTILWIFFQSSWILLILGTIWSLWEGCSHSHLGWSKLQKLHRIIDEEKWEIEHHFPQERAELEKIYSAKGFSGQLLEDVINTLMADSNRLLQVMLEEEMGIALGSYEHPLKQGFWALFGSLATTLILSLGAFLFSLTGLLIFALTILGVSSFFVARYEKNNISTVLIWNWAILLFLTTITFFLHQLFLMKH